MTMRGVGRRGGRNLGVDGLFGLLALSVWMCSGCSCGAEGVWASRGGSIRKYGEEFISQETALSVSQDGVSSFSIVTVSRLEVEFSLDENRIRWIAPGDFTWTEVDSFDELEQLSGVTEGFAMYWANAIVELKTYRISKVESLGCEHVYISSSESPPFQGNKAAGWFLIPWDEQYRSDCITGLRQVDGEWLEGRLRW